MPQLVLLAILTLNVVAFLAFGIDKRKAIKGQRRIPETTLLFLAWATGVFGAWLGMSVFRHKTAKMSFRIKMVLVTILNPTWLVLYL